MILMGRIFLIFLFLFVMIHTVSLSAQEVDILKTGVVKVVATTHEGMQKVGTGFIVQLEMDAVYIVTASHVVEGTREVEVEFFTRRNRLVPSKVTNMEGGDPMGLAILIVGENIPSGLSVLKLNSSISVSERDHVITIGFPRIANVPWAVIGGNIVGPRGSAITFSGAVDEGNSGGPLIKQGQVIGVVTEVTKKFAYAIPAVIAQYTLKGWGVSPEKEAVIPPVVPERFFVTVGSVINRFSKKSDGTIYDKYLKKRWFVVRDKIFDWDQGREYCQSLDGNWRLPTKKELESLITKKQYKGDWGKIDGNFFPKDRVNKYWTISQGRFGTYWYVDFSNGTWGEMSKTNNYAVLAINDK